MRADLFWRPQAREDLLEIYVAIAIDNLDAAERLYMAMESKANLLVNHPRLGVRGPEIQRSARILMEEPYLILYETHPDTEDGLIESIEIVRVVDGRRDLSRPF